MIKKKDNHIIGVYGWNAMPFFLVADGYFVFFACVWVTNYSVSSRVWNSTQSVCVYCYLFPHVPCFTNKRGYKLLPLPPKWLEINL